MPTQTQYWSLADNSMFRTGDLDPNDGRDTKIYEWYVFDTQVQHDRIWDAWELWDDVSAFSAIESIDDVNLARDAASGETTLSGDWTRMGLAAVAVSNSSNLGSNRFTGDYGRYHELYINIHTLGSNDLVLGSTAAHSLIHEIGHSVMGSPLDAGKLAQIGVTGDKGHMAEGDVLATVMGSTATNEDFDDGAEIWHPSTPMTFDIDYTIAYYGETFTTRRGSDTYGFNVNLGNEYRAALDFNVNKRPLVTIYDNGGFDTLDASGFRDANGFARPVQIDLHPNGESSMLDDGGQTFAVIYGGLFSWTWIEAARGGNADDIIYGNQIENSLYGGGGSDHLYGFEGVDRLSGGEGRDFIFGGTEADFLYGEGGNDELNGESGNDDMYGGAGNDVYVVSDSGDRVFEQPDAFGGTDKIYTTLGAYDMAAYGKGEWVEDLQYTGGGSFTGYGNARNNALVGNNGNDTLYGYGGNDVLVGGKGADWMYGGTGDDTYYVDNANDVLTEEPNFIVTSVNGQLTVQAWGGTDTVRVDTAGMAATGRWYYTVLSNFENAALDGTVANFALYGNDLGNLLYGNNQANTMYGYAGLDTMYGLDGADWLYGGDDNDALVGGNGNDVLDAGHGTDTMWGDADQDTFMLTGSGDKTVHGGTGIDTMSLAGSINDQTINLLAGRGQYIGGGSTANSAWAGIYNLVWDGIENLTSGNGRDVLTGDYGNNTIEAGGGNDIIYLNAGHDTVIGGEGIDTMSLAGLSSNQNINLGAYYASYIGGGSYTNGGFAGIYNLWWGGIENLTTGAGNDTLKGDDGNNVLDGGTGNDLLIAGLGSDRFIGGLGTDTLAFTDSTTQAASVDLALLSGSYSSGGSTATSSWGAFATFGFSSIENVVGSNGGDTLNGDGLANELSGRNGNDTLRGAGGNDIVNGGFKNAGEATGSDGDDTLYGDAGNDTFIVNSGSDKVYGGTEIDTLTFGASVQAATVNLAAGGGNYSAGGSYPFGAWGGYFALTTNSVENIVGSAGGDTLTGDGLVNYLVGGAGNDTLRGGGGNDVIYGGYKTRADVTGPDGDDVLWGDDGQDTFFVLFGNDVVHGGAGVDNLSFSEVTSNLTVDLAAGRTTYSEGQSYANGGFAGLYTVTWDGIENIGTGSGNDVLIGNRGSNVLNGGAGTDTAVFHGNRTHYAITKNANGTIQIADSVAGRDGSDLLINIEKVRFADGEVAASTLQTAPANLYLYGTSYWGGTVMGGAGNDTVSYGAATYAIYVDLARDGGYAQALTGSNQPTAHLVSIENVAGAPNNLNYLHGNAAANTLMGGNLSDWFTGRGGSNTLYGQSGVDLADYLETNAPVTIDLTTGKATHSTGVDTLNSIEQARGSNWADKFIGNAVDNYFLGMAGNDVASGNGGKDWLEGNDGADTLNGGAGADKLIGGLDNDILTGGTEADRFVFRTADRGQDRVTDFRYAEGDRIDFSEHTTVNQLSHLTIASGTGGALISFASTGGTSSILLEGIAASSITHDWFVF